MSKKKKKRIYRSPQAIIKKSPLQRVRDEHSSKEALAKKVVNLLSPAEGESYDDFEYRISHISNTKLLRLWDAHQQLEKSYGSRDSLIGQISKAKFGNSNEDYEKKLTTFSTPKLLELAKQHSL